MNIGVVVARFQVDDLHDGHQLLLKAVAEENDIVMVVLGTCAPKNTQENPLDFETRELMVKEVLPGAIVVPLADHVDDSVWSDNLDQLVWSMAQANWDVRLYGGRDSFRDYYTGYFETVPFGHVHHASGTDVRAGIGRMPRGSADFRAGVIYASQNRYPQTFPTVDVAVWHGDQLLLGRKEGMDKFCLIGGFVDPTDETLEAAARREVGEEVNLSIYGLQYVCSTIVDDWRYRKGPDKIMTTLFNASVAVYDPEPEAADDIVECLWIPESKFQTRADIEERVQPCHVGLVARAITARSTP